MNICINKTIVVICGMLVKSKINCRGIKIGKTYEALGYCSQNKHFIILNDFKDMFPYLVTSFEIIDESMDKKAKFKAMIESKTFLQ